MKENLQNQINQQQLIIDSIAPAIQEIGDRRTAIEQELKALREGNLNGLFGDVLEEFGMSVFQNYEGAYVFKRAVNPDNFHSGLFTLYSRVRYGDDYEMNINYYTGRCDSPEEFDRLTALGLVARRVKMFTPKDLFDCINVGGEELLAEDKELQEKQRDLNQVERNATIQIDNLKSQMLTLDLKKGVNFNKPVNLEFNSNKCKYNVVRARIVKVSASGKTCDVELTSEYNSYPDGFDKDPVVRTDKTVFERTKLDDVIYNIRFALAQLKANEELAVQ